MTARRAAGRLATIRASLSERDLAILTDLARVRLLTARQVERLHFTDGTPGSRSRRSRRVLKRLHSLGLTTRLQRRVGGVHAGSAGYIYALSSLGQRLLDTPGPAGGARRRKPWEPSAHFVDHILDTAETYVLLHEAAAGGELDLLQFDTEPACWRSATQFGGATLLLKPDAYVRVGIDDFEQVSFVEIDRGTEHTPTLRRKLAAYVDAYHAGIEQEDGQAFPNVVWITPDDQRAELIRGLIARLPPEQAELFAVTTNHPDQQINTLKGGES